MGKQLHQLLFYLLLIFLPTQLGYHFWPAWAMVLGRRVDYLSPTLFLTDILIISICITYIWTRRFRFTMSALRNKYILFFFAFCLLLFFHSPTPGTLYSLYKLIEFFCLGIYIYYARPSRKKIVFFLSLAATYSCLIGIFQFIFQHSLGGPLWFLGERTFSSDTPGIATMQIGQYIPFFFKPGVLYLRAYGTLPHPNVLGGLITTALLLLLTTKHSWRWYQYIFVLFLCMGLFLTGNRSAWIITLITCSVYLLSTFRSKLYRFKRTSGLCILLLLICVLLYTILSHVSLQEESIYVRSDLLIAAFTLWKNNMVLGIGLGQFLIHLPEVLRSHTIFFLQPVHNIYMLVLTETGFVGLFAFLFTIFYALRKKSFFILPLLGLLCLGFFDHYLLTLQQGQLLLTIIIAATFAHPKLD